tara:strand:+ start:1288 stop:1395 length:108 start_codon:yes stop_codon:yes gene_type:complete
MHGKKYGNMPKPFFIVFLNKGWLIFQAFIEPKNYV